MVNPLVRSAGLGEILKRDADAQTPPPQRDIASRETESALAGHVRAAWGRNRLFKQRIDLRLLADLRARRGVYSPAELSAKQQAGGVNIIWYDLTETKCRAASASVREIVMPQSGERPWGLDPTPIPDLPDPIKDRITRRAMQQAQEVMVQAEQAGGGIMDRDEFKDLAVQLGEKLRTEAEETAREIARKRAHRMERQINDRLAQGNWEMAVDGFIEDFVTYPAAILKGPVFERSKRLEWGEGFKPKVSYAPHQMWNEVSPFDVYPAPGAETPQQGDFIERMRLFRDDLYALRGLPGYRDDQIEAALFDYSNGHLEGWLWTEAERQRLTAESMYMWLTPPGKIDVLNYWGSVPGWKLMSWGIKDIDDPVREFEVNVLVCGRYILYAALNPNPLGERPYRRACYDAIPGAFWGRSIPELCETAQRFCNVAGCAMADNISMASGPMAWVHNDRLADGEQTLEIIPWKVWQLKDAGMGAGTNPGIGFFQASDNTAQLSKVLDFWELKADDATGIPRYTYGNDQVQGAAGTATGLSMLLNSAAKGLRRAISHIDLNVIAPTIGDCFVNEMLYNPDESIKGDAIVVPRGAAAILIKDMAQQRRMQFLGMTANPIDMAIIGNRGRAELLRQTANAMELGEGIVPSEEQMEEQQAAQAQAMEQQQMAAVQAEQQAKVQEIQMQTQSELVRTEAQTRADGQREFQKLIGDVVREQARGENARDVASMRQPPKKPGNSGARA